MMNKSIDVLLTSVGVRIKTQAQKCSLKNYSNANTVSTFYPVTIENDKRLLGKFKIFGVNPMNEDKQRTSIVACFDNGINEDYFILVRGEQAAFKNCLEMGPNEQTLFRNLMVKYKGSLLSRVIFAYRKLTFEEMESYISTYLLIQNSKKNDVAGINKISIPLEKDLKFISSIGYKTRVKKEAFDLVKNLQKAVIQVSVLTGDNFENTINVIKELKISSTNFYDKASYFLLDFDSQDYEKANMELLGYLESVYHQIKSKQNEFLNYYLKYLNSNVEEFSKNNSSSNYSNLEDITEEANPQSGKNSMKGTAAFKKNLVISGSAFEAIQASPKLSKLLKILLLFANSIIGYDLEPCHKGYFVDILRSMDQVVLAIGDGLNDIAMFNQSNLSIQLVQGEVPIHYGDLLVNNLDIINVLIFHTGFNMYKNIKMAILFCLVVSTKFLFVNMWYFNLSDFSGRDTNPLYFDFLTLIIVSDGLFRSLYHQTYPDRFTSRNPIVYQEHHILSFKLPMLIVLTLGILFGEIVFAETSISLFFLDMKMPNGQQVFQDMTNALFYLVLFTNSSLLDLFFSTQSQKYRWVTPIAFLVTIITVILVFFFNTVADPASIFSLGILGDRHILSLLLICVLVPSYLKLSLLFVILNKIINPVKHLVKYTFRQGSKWGHYCEKSTDPWNGVLKRILKKKSLSFDSSLNNLINRISQIARRKNTKGTKNSQEPIITKLLLINIHEFKLGFNHVWNKIIDLRDNQRFILVFMRTQLRNSIFLLWLGSALYLIKFIYNNYVLLSEGSSIAEVFLSPILYNMIFCGLLAFFLAKKKTFESKMVFVMKIFFSLVLLFDSFLLAFSLYSRKNDGARRYLLPGAIIPRLLSSSLPLPFLLSVFFIISFEGLAIVFRIFLFGPIAEVFPQKSYLTILLLYNLFMLALKVSLRKKYDKTCKINFLSVKKQKTEISKAKDKLSMLMPVFVWDKINTEGLQESFAADDAGEITILFCDLCGFDSIVSACSEKIVDILDELFRMFDYLCRKHSIQKLETVGKTYMACGGLKFVENKIDNPNINKNYTERVFDLALDMMTFVHKNTFAMGTKLTLKIGIHHGNCTFGVIGYHKPQFSLIGDTVNTTSRHCTTGKEGAIILSLEAHSRIDTLRYPPLTRLEAYMKGKGQVPVFSITPFSSKDGPSSAVKSILKRSQFAPSSRDFQELESEQPSLRELSRVNSIRNSLIHDQISVNALERPNSPQGFRRLASLVVGEEEDGFFKFSSDKSLVVQHSLPDSNSLDDSFDEPKIFEKDYSINMPQVMKSFKGYVYGFKPEKASLEKFYNKQIRIKYKTKLKRTMFVLTFLMFAQEVLLWIGFDSEFEVNSIRVATYLWIFMSSIYLFLSSKVYKSLVLVFIFSKTFLHLLELYFLKYLLNPPQSKVNLAYFIFMYSSMIDSLFLISVGLFPLTELFLLNAFSFVLLLGHTLLFLAKEKSLVSFCIYVFIHYIFNVIDIISHYDKETTAFFNFLRIEQRGYYLSSFVDRLLPKHIKGVESASTQLHENVTLLFADIEGYTAYSAGKKPRQVVELLSKLFTAFDKECNRLNLYKLYTIGDAYVVMGFLDKNSRKHPREEATDVIHQGIFMLETIRRVREKIKFDKLNMRIGIHTGKIYAGIIGRDIVRFDIYGPDVLIANKMESKGQAGRICLSETTKALLDELETTNYTFEPHQRVELPSLGRSVQSYLLGAERPR